jgi:hypothetical protein
VGSEMCIRDRLTKICEMFFNSFTVEVYHV